ncbi:glycyl-tRNA synthetase [Halohasta litchfieldiae]|jgi:glycyl-tRNA synthetase, dimeric type|uniref:glycine--tRNA ligase n=1 Tax=Halohasta litchfieldiae TaxID=1073996 RepID=A0A1H6QWD9_9EURY|nr:glycine--tRNA ligase [Halohasta litchfieldiae]ATW88619.1 glycyl-tRNA synthetase [Halohasta litchfieldiae]SEI47853.1 glycyl-tRNA synthetase [Halohasta litchfieldiae]
MAEQNELMELAKRRGFFFGSNGAYGGTAGFYTFGPEGASLKHNVESAWRDQFTVRLGNDEIEAPTIMPEAVFEASGHLDGFDDMLVECAECGESHRADHLIEDAVADIEDAEALGVDKVEDLIREHDLACPTCGADLADEPVEDFNLMFETSIGPGSGQPGYMRPETAQGIFVEFPRLKEYARGQLPFGVTQIGPAYRNEISPRRGIIRVREFTQAELEQFIDPDEDEPPLGEVRDVEVTLYPATEQNAEDGGYVDTTIGEAVDEEIIGSPWVAYYLGIAQEWYERVGVDMDRFRFRQHLTGERAHYAADCWDAESEISGNWIEIAGFAYRGDYDLTKHGEYSEDRFTIFKRYDEPVTVEKAVVDPDMSALGPEFGGAAADVAEGLQALAEDDPDAFEGDEVTVETGGESYTVDTEVANFSVEEQTESGEHITPHVVEPSFGVGRTVYTLLEHGYSTDEVDGETRSYLSLKPEVAPTNVAVFPLVSNDDQLIDVAENVSRSLRQAGISVTYDDSGSIGRRYRRQDEVGTPFCVTVDQDGLESDGEPTVTLRERDSATQIRLPVEAVAEELEALLAGNRGFSDLRDRYGNVETDVTTT